MIHIQGSLGLAALVLAFSFISNVHASCVEDRYGNVSCSPFINPRAVVGLAIGVVVILFVVFMLFRQRRRVRTANMAYVYNAQAQPQAQQPGFPASPYASPYAPTYAPPYAPPYGPPPPNPEFGYNSELPHNKNFPPGNGVNAPQYPPPSYAAA